MNWHIRLVLLIFLFIIGIHIGRSLKIAGILVFIILIILIFIVEYIAKQYNKLISRKNEVMSSWSMVDIQLQRRADLIPKLVETVKVYGAHEQETFESISKARNGLKNSNSVNEADKYNNQLSKSIKNLFAIAENYPELKANENFIILQKELSQTENLIAIARVQYNNKVLIYNNVCEQFPSIIIARIFHFKKAQFFQANIK